MKCQALYCLKVIIIIIKSFKVSFVVVVISALRVNPFIPVFLSLNSTPRKHAYVVLT